VASNLQPQNQLSLKPTLYLYSRRRLSQALCHSDTWHCGSAAVSLATYRGGEPGSNLDMTVKGLVGEVDAACRISPL
jgi:hypothetical protein